ncbi:MAG: thermonuclease family protein [Alphaproteobacteria bacterium]|nr:thermonuclease family protein [Alphaproteobacteria bacterium]
MNFYFFKPQRIGEICGILFLVVVIAAGYYSSASAEFVKVVDGDSLEIGQRRIRLKGIDAPEYKQYCYDFQKQKYDCGRESQLYLKNLLKQANYKVSCNTHQKDRYGRELSVCFANGKNLNLAMIEAGWAVTYRTENKKYTTAEKTAQREKNGVWQGKFMRPEYYRRLHRRKNR